MGGACVDAINERKKGQLGRPVNKLYRLEFAVSNDDTKIEFISDIRAQMIRNGLLSSRQGKYSVNCLMKNRMKSQQIPTITLFTHSITAYYL